MTMNGRKRGFTSRHHGVRQGVATIWLTPALVLVVGGCGGQAGPPTPEPTPTTTDPPSRMTCAALIRGVELEPTVAAPTAGVSEGRIDPSVAHDPTTGRVWMVYSGAEGGPFVGRPFQVSQRLAFSDDRGASWCDHGEVVPVADLGDDCPPDSDGPCHFNQEVGTLVHTPGAPPARRWKLFYFTVAATPDNNYPFAQYLVREASQPEALAAATPRRLFAGGSFEFPPVAAWMDRHAAGLGPTEVRLDQLHPDLENCLQFSELGTAADGDRLWASFLCADPREHLTVLVSTDDPELRAWRYHGVLVDGDDVRAIDASSPNYSASELFFGRDGQLRLSVSPVRAANNGSYHACHIYRVTDPETATVAPEPERVVTPNSETVHHGMCTYDPALTETGLIAAQVFESRPFIRLIATGETFP
ncbi:MAG: sialidase family protein [Myxococcota bacterium]